MKGAESNLRNERLRSAATRTSLYLLLTVLFAFCIGPMTWAVSSSLKSAGDIFEYPPRLIPSPLTVRNYSDLLSGHPFFAWMATSFVVAIVSTVLAVLVCSLAGYGFACFRFRGKRFLFDLMFSSLAVPFVVIAVPLFIMLSRIGVTNEYVLLIVPWIAPAFGIFMMRQYTEQSVPPDLLEAARVDGCSEFRIYWQIVVPLLRPGLGALGVWTFINSYNSFLWPLIAIGNPDRFTLPLGLQALFGAQSHQFNLVMAGSVLASLPAIIIFLALRRQLIEGLSAGSIKG